MSEIVIVGAAGWAGIELIKALAAVDADFSAVSHSDGGSARLRDAGAPHVVRADLGDPSSLAAAFAGTRMVYAIPPALHAREDDYIINAVRAAEASGVERFVFHSVMHSYTPFLRNHIRKARVESVLKSSALAWTIVQPSMYAQMVIAIFGGQSGGVVKVPFDIDSEISMLDLTEGAEVGAKILTEPGFHDYATYELAGPITTLRRTIAAIGRARGIELRSETVGVSEGPLPPAAASSPEAAADMISTYAHYDQHGFRGSTFALTQLLGRAPATVEDVVARQFDSATR